MGPLTRTTSAGDAHYSILWSPQRPRLNEGRAPEGPSSFPLPPSACESGHSRAGLAGQTTILPPSFLLRHLDRGLEAQKARLRHFRQLGLSAAALLSLFRREVEFRALSPAQGSAHLLSPSASRSQISWPSAAL